MKLSFSTRGWMDLSWDEIVSDAAEMRFGGIELYNVTDCPAFVECGGAFHKYSVVRTYRELREAGLMRVPKDADGMFVHVGDEMCGYGCSDGGVYCQAVINNRMILVGTNPISAKSWMLWSASGCRHYHKPTVVELLHMFLSESEDAMRKGYDEVPDEIYAEYAEKLREVIDGD